MRRTVGSFLATVVAAVCAPSQVGWPMVAGRWRPWTGGGSMTITGPGGGVWTLLPSRPVVRSAP